MAQIRSRRRQGDGDPTLVLCFALPSDETGQFKALQQRGDGPGIHPDLVTQLSDGARRAREKLDDHEVLRER